MKRRLFKQIFLSSLTVLALTVCVLFFFASRSLRAENRSHLQSEMELAEAAIAAGRDALDDADSRIQRIAPDGTCLLDTDGDTADFDPDAQPELAQARQSGEGWDIRRTENVAKQIMSYARLLPDGSVLIVSDDGYQEFSLFLQMFTPLLMLVLGIVILAAVMAHHGARTLTEPLDCIDFSRPDERDVEEEIRPLVRRLAAQNRKIRQQMEDLAEEHALQDKYRREFTANVSHELKTPLTSISGFAELIRDGLAKPEDVPRFAGRIHDECHRLIGLVGDIIRLSRLDDGTMMPEKEPVSLQAVTELVFTQLETAAQNKQVQLRFAGTAGVIPAVRQMAEEVVFNLCDNGVKYNVSGGTVTVTVEETEEAAILTVEDTGIGIPEADVPRIFERFYRVDKSHSKEVGGTGLGLSIVKHCALYHGAEIRVSSQLGQGTAVTICFPKERGN